MRIILPHKKTKQQVIEAVDRSIDDVFKGLATGPIEIVDQHKSWSGPVLTFALTAKMGMLSTPIKGTIEVTDRDITIDADLGILERMIPAKKAQELVSQHVRGLLK